MTKQNQNRQTRKVELSLQDLESVSGGTHPRKAGGSSLEFLKIKLEKAWISS